MERVIIVTPPSETAAAIEQLLRNEGFSPVNVVNSGSEMRRMIKNGISADLVIINAPLPDEFGNDLAETAAEESAAAVIMICSGDIAVELESGFADLGIATLPKPISGEAFSRCLSDIEELHGNFRNVKESAEILCRIDDMRLINRAKSTLMKYLQFTEPQAHRYLEKYAMNNRCTRREAAIHIINIYEK